MRKLSEKSGMFWVFRWQGGSLNGVMAQYTYTSQDNFVECVEHAAREAMDNDPWVSAVAIIPDSDMSLFIQGRRETIEVFVFKQYKDYYEKVNITDAEIKRYRDGWSVFMER